MKNGDKSYETNAHNKNNVWGDLESRSIICVKLEHAPSCPSRGCTACCSPPPHACSCCRTSPLGGSSCYHFRVRVGLTDAAAGSRKKLCSVFSEETNTHQPTFFAECNLEEAIGDLELTLGFDLGKAGSLEFCIFGSWFAATMATIAPPVAGLSMVSLRPAYSNRFQPLKSSFLSYGVGALNVPHLRIAHSNRLRCNCQGGGALGAQMNLFSRFARIIKSYANAILSSFEDPEKIIEQTVLDMNNDLIKMRQATAQVLASQKQLENKYKAAQKASEDWYARAQLALTKGDEDLAREALKRRKGYAENSGALKAQLDQQKSVVDNLVSNTRLLESKIQEAKSKKDVLKARAQSAKTSTRVSELVGNIDTSGALDAFNKMEDKVLAMESQADAYSQLMTDDLEGKFQLLERSSVDDDLESLKKELSGNSKKGELPPGRTAVAVKQFPFRDSEIENELNELRRKSKEY